MVKKLRFWKLTLVKSVPLVVCLLLLTAVFNIYVVTLDAEKLTSKRDAIEAEHKEKMWTNIETVIDVTNAAARQNSRYLASKIETDLLKEYPVMDTLKREFQTKNFSDRFYKVLQDNLETQNNNPSAIYRPSFFTIVGIEDGVISVFSNESVSTLSARNEDDIIDWESYAKSFPNKELALKAIESVLNRKEGVIFWSSTRTSDSKIPVDQQIDPVMEMSSLKKTYQKYGMDGLNSLSIVSPSYITENGDIFSTADRHFMSKSKNYKLVIVQSFALADILERNGKSITLEEQSYARQLNFMDEQIHHRYIESLMLGFILFMISGVLIGVYNHERSSTKRAEGD